MRKVLEHEPERRRSVGKMFIFLESCSSNDNPFSAAINSEANGSLDIPVQVFLRGAFSEKRKERCDRLIDFIDAVDDDVATLKCG